MTDLAKYDDDILNRVARQKNPRVKRWVGIRGGSLQKRVICYICGGEIDTYAANWPMPKHVQEAIREHRPVHININVTRLIGDTASE